MSWNVIVCEPQREAKLAKAIQEAGFEVFAPTYVAWRGRFSRYTEIRRPLINGYIFAVMDPHEVHGFHGDGASRIIPMNWRLSLQLAHKVQEWRERTEAGDFDDARPEEPTARPIRTSRNRKARRQAGIVKAAVMDFRDGLEVILAEMKAPQPIAA